ncbi:MAG TPA: hypothetical protein VFI11_09360 [Anaerolineales bacterium]|nr:hypothetical protein [Anaerolineales bacterium]
MNQAQETARALRVKDKYESDLLAKANVLGVGVGYRHRAGLPTREICLIVMVRRKVSAADLAPDDRIPAQIDGVPVDVHEIGEVRARA